MIGKRQDVKRRQTYAEAELLGHGDCCVITLGSRRARVAQKGTEAVSGASCKVESRLRPLTSGGATPSCIPNLQWSKVFSSSIPNVYRSQ